jgi:hypothetical protein
MKLFFATQFLFISILSFSQIQSAPELRKKFYASVKDYGIAKKFLKELEQEPQPLSAIQTGYKAAVTMVMADHVFNPYCKFKYFLDGKAELEKILLLHPLNYELRLIRFAIQSNIPGFLGYANNINEDKTFLISQLKQESMLKNKDVELIKISKQYLTESKHCTEAEKKSINQL